MTFLMWPLLLGALAAGIPIVIHLLHRRQARRVRWGAMQFLRASPLQSRRARRVERWLLMALRMLAIAILAVALARPRWAPATSIPRGGLTDAPVDVAVVLDHSFSTGRLREGQTIFNRGVQVVDEVIRQLKPADTISVVLAEHAPRALTEEPIHPSDTAAIQDLGRRLAELKPGLTDCSIPDAIGAARRLIDAGPRAGKLILVISDHRRASWHINDAAVWRAAIGRSRPPMPGRLAVHSIPILPDPDAANASVGNISVEPKILGVGRPVQINATVSNTSNKPLGAFTARLIADGRQLGVKPVDQLAAKASATIHFDLEAGFDRAGSHTIQMAIDVADALAADNQAAAVADVVKCIPILIIDGQLSAAGDFEASRFLAAALQPVHSSIVQAKTVSLTTALAERLDDYLAIVVNDPPTLPASLRDGLADYVRAGHGVWFILGPRTSRSVIDNDLADAGLFRSQGQEVKTAPSTPGGIDVKDPLNPMVALLSGGRRNALVGALTRSWWSLVPQDADAKVVLAASNGDPLAIERPCGPNRGLVVLWTTGVDGAWNNWHLMPNFVPLVNETIYHLASPQMPGFANRSLTPGEPIEWTAGATPAVQDVRITRPDGTTVHQPGTFNSGRWVLTYPDTFLPGIYHLTFTPPDIEPVSYAVNIDASVLDPAMLERADVDWLTRSRFLDADHPTIDPSHVGALLKREGSGIELWAWLGLVLLGTLLLETWIARRLIPTTTPAAAPALASGNYR